METKRILVLVNGKSVDDEVVKLACNLAKKSKAKVDVVNIIEVERSLPLDTPVDSEAEKAEEILSHAEDVAREINCDVETDLIQAREAGPAIVDTATERKADLIVMGTGYKKHLGVFDLGRTISHILKEAPCQILLYRGSFSKDNSK